MTERYSYDVFGEPTIRDSGDVPRDTSDYGNSRLFTGREFDGETGLYYYRADTIRQRAINSSSQIPTAMNEKYRLGR